MAITDESEKGAGQTPKSPTPSWVTTAKRYGPIAAIVVLIAGAVIIFGGGDDDGGDGGNGSGNGSETEVATGDELILSGPMTPERAELEGVEVDFGDGCDLETGRIKFPSVYAVPCVEPFEGDNGGATSMGVTADEIKIVYYQTDPALDPLNASAISGAGADVNPETARQALDEFVGLYNDIFETYGRTLVVENFTGTGAGDDVEAARADAVAIAELEPFAVIGGPAQAGPVFGPEIASAGIVCGPGCALALPNEMVEEYAPYMWSTGPTPQQASALAAEMVGKLAGPGKAELAGSDEIKAEDRVYALLHYDTPDGDQEQAFESLVAALEDNGIDLELDIEFNLDLARGQETARTNIGKLMDAGVTTIIYYGDPLTPANLTTEATAQGYFPEWILGPNVLADTTVLARRFDGEQWKNGFGIALTGARGALETNGAFEIWDWAFGGEPPNNTANVFEPYLRTIFSGIHLAGPELSPETFRDALYRAPISGGGPTQPQVSRGDHGVWPDHDWGGSDDAGLIWWDPEAEGEDEVGNDGVGMYRYANEGERYTLGEFPESLEEAGLFDVESSITVFDEVPEEDTTPDYPPPS